MKSYTWSSNVIQSIFFLFRIIVEENKIYSYVYKMQNEEINYLNFFFENLQTLRTV